MRTNINIKNRIRALVKQNLLNGSTNRKEAYSEAINQLKKQYAKNTNIKNLIKAEHLETLSKKAPKRLRNAFKQRAKNTISEELRRLNIRASKNKTSRGIGKNLIKKLQLQKKLLKSTPFKAKMEKLEKKIKKIRKTLKNGGLIESGYGKKIQGGVHSKPIYKKNMKKSGRQLLEEGWVLGRNGVLINMITGEIRSPDANEDFEEDKAAMEEDEAVEIAGEVLV